MKKTRLISAVALLLTALMLFSACSINYRTADASKYVHLSEEAYKNLKVTLDRSVVDADDVTEYINKMLYNDYKVAKGEAEGGGKDQPGEFVKHDVLTYRLFLYDNGGKLIEHDFAIASKTDTASATISVNEYPYLTLGYGLNKGLKAEIESKIMGALFQTHNSADNNIGTTTAGALSSVPVVAYLTYTSNYASSSANGSVDTAGSKDNSTIKPIHLEPYFSKETVGENDFNEAIYLGLKQVIENQVANDPENLVTPGKDNVITINVYPVGTELPSNATVDAKTAHISYNLDFLKNTETPDYRRGEIKVTFNAAVTMRDDSEDAGAFKVEFTYTAENSTVDTDGNFKTAAGNVVTAANAKCTAWVYVHSRQAYTCPEYNADFITNTLNFTTTEADVVAAHRESIRKMLQDAVDAEVAAAAKKAIWEAASKATTMIKEPKRNIKNYVKGVLNKYKTYYYDYGYKNQTTADGTPYYKDFEAFLVTIYSEYSSQAAIESALYDEGKEIIKKNLLAYYLADALGIRYTTEQMDVMIVEKGHAWAAAVVNEIRRTLNGTLGESTAPEDVQTAASEILSYYYNSTTGGYYITAADVTDDFVTWETYLAMYGEENLSGAYHVDLVAEKLYELNVNNITYTTKDYTRS